MFSLLKATCETAENFFTVTIEPKWKHFERLVSNLSDSGKTTDFVVANFPFIKFFTAGAPTPIFHKSSFVEDLQQAKICW